MKHLPLSDKMRQSNKERVKRNCTNVKGNKINPYNEEGDSFYEDMEEIYEHDGYEFNKNSEEY